MEGFHALIIKNIIFKKQNINRNKSTIKRPVELSTSSTVFARIVLTTLLVKERKDSSISMMSVTSDIIKNYHLFK